MSIDVVCLGVGKGASYIVKGIPSTSFVVRLDGHPKLLIDCGLGVCLSYQRHIGRIFPEMVYISHNHTDHTGELPILLGLLPGKPRILGNQAVLGIVQQHRLHEVVSKHIEDIAEWIPADRSGNIDIGDGLSLHLFRSVHSYLCYGFMLHREGQPILGYPADTAFDENIYDRVTQAPFVILDGRDQGNHDHASLKDIDRFAQRVLQCSIRVVHYEETDYVFAAPNVKLWREGDVMSLDT